MRQKYRQLPGAKDDSQKLLADDILRMFAGALTAVCSLGTKGARKYSLGGWKQTADGARRYANAQMRHKLREWSGETIDAETQELHATADAWNALARLEFILQSHNDSGSIATPRKPRRRK